MTALPQSAPDFWDEVAARVRAAAPGAWVVVRDEQRQGGARTDKARAALALRGLTCEVASRKGDGSSERSWSGWRLFARRIGG